MGPGPAQIWRISGFVNSKTDGENAAGLSELWCDLQKKKVFTENLTVFLVEIRWSPKKKVFTENLAVFPVEIWCHQKKKFFKPHMLISQGHLDGPAETNGFPDAHGPRGYCTPCPPLGGPEWEHADFKDKYLTE